MPNTSIYNNYDFNLMNDNTNYKMLLEKVNELKYKDNGGHIDREK